MPTKKQVKPKKKRDIPYTEQPRLIYESYKNAVDSKIAVMIGIPTTGNVRFEWYMAMTGMVIPVCFAYSASARPILMNSPQGYLVAEARNLILGDFIKKDVEWLLFIDHDVLPHPYTWGFFMEHMLKKDYPIVSGLYYAKGDPSLPLVFRGRGAGPYLDWKLGDQVEVDGVVMGMTLMHRSIIEYLHKNSPVKQTRDNHIIKEVFVSPRQINVDPETLSWSQNVGTEDLYLCQRIISENILSKTGWKKLAKKKYPFLTDTRIFCKHIDNNGIQYPKEFNII